LKIEHFNIFKKIFLNLESLKNARKHSLTRPNFY